MSQTTMLIACLVNVLLYYFIFSVCEKCALCKRAIFLRYRFVFPDGNLFSWQFNLELHHKAYVNANTLLFKDFLVIMRCLSFECTLRIGYSRDDTLHCCFMQITQISYNLL